MKHHWYLPLTQEQFDKLKAGLLSRFRFQIRLEIATIQYNFGTHDLSVYIPKGVKPDNTHDSISDYINGFTKAIEA